MNPPLSHTSRNQFRSVPIEYPLSRTARGLLAGWCLCLAGGFVLAGSLDPDPRGYGTHQRFGLPECSVRMFLKIPCPSCGMTTSFAHFTRGQWADAARANPAGLLLALVCALQIPWGLVSLWRGRLWGVAQPGLVLLTLLLAVGSVAVVNWIARVML